jgi:hypothetical protein
MTHPVAREVMVRHAPDDFSALTTAQGMEDALATVISITLNHLRHASGESQLRFCIFCAFNPRITTTD